MKKRLEGLTTPSLDPSHLQCLAVPEVAQLLSVRRTTVYALIRRGTLQTVKVGNCRRVLLLSVQQYLKRQAS
jgi:excisionase family DNA binding protein